MSQSELLTHVVRVLNGSKTDYMLTGSYASSVQGEPRLTHDIDFVVALTSVGAKALLAAFPPPDFYLDEMAIRSAIAAKTQFNLLDLTGGDQVDFWILTDEAFDRARFERRYAEDIDGTMLFVSSPEDTILMKLHWAQISGGSEKQMADVRSVFELQGEKIDRAYVEKWAIELNVMELWVEISGNTPFD